MAKNEQKGAANEARGVGQVQDQLAKEQEQGFRGTKVDPEDNKVYTVEGVTKD